MKKRSISEEDILINGMSSYAVRAMAEKMGFLVEAITPIYIQLYLSTSGYYTFEGQKLGDKSTIYFGTAKICNTVSNLDDNTNSASDLFTLNSNPNGAPIRFVSVIDSKKTDGSTIENSFLNGEGHINISSGSPNSLLIFTGFKLAVQRS